MLKRLFGAKSAPRATKQPALTVEKDEAVDELFPWLVGPIEYCDRYGSLVVQVDKTGFMVPIKVASAQSKLEPTQLLGFTARWLRALRTVKQTPDGQMELVDQVYAHLVPGSAAALKVSEWYRKDNPLVSAGKRLVEVEILRMHSGNSAHEITIEWRERSKVMSASETKLYSAFISLQYGGIPQEQKYLIINPVGVYIGDVQISTIGEEHDRP
jgi:type IV secretory pathway TrbF-like protein